MVSLDFVLISCRFKMSSYVDMSLEDIIRQKKKQNVRPQQIISKPRKQIQPQKAPVPVTDARNKIISNKRTRITDAREKLAELAKQKDARLKLEKLREARAKTQQIQGRYTFQNRGKFVRNVANKEIVFTDSSRQVVSQPLKTSKLPSRHQLNPGRFMEHRSIERTRFIDKLQKPKPIVRTVENDIEMIDEPMEEEYLPPKISMMNRKASLQLKIIAHNNDIRDNRTAIVHRTAVTEIDKSPPRLPSILKKREKKLEASRTEGAAQRTEKPHLEYRIIVSNLRNTVTAGDIQELFGDVGAMVESRLVRSGTAEVIYKTQEDAQRAVDLYHNRQLDGQPMNCLLVTPRLPTTTARNTNNKPALYSTNSNVEPDLSTFHKVLFSNL